MIPNGKQMMTIIWKEIDKFMTENNLSWEMDV